MPSRFDIQVHTHDVSLQFPRNFQTDLGSLYLSCRRNVMEQMFGCCFDFPCEWDTSLQAGPQETLPLKNDFQASTGKPCTTLRTQEAGKVIFLKGRKGIHRECVVRPLSCSNCFASKTSDLQACSEDLHSRVRAVCLPVLSEPCKHNPRSAWSCL